ncbi:MAG: glycosyltransferase family 4 protein [Bacteroidales bacterium]|nr:glycosyltransferase family 4 protein [Bacteroidales bacterium]
MAKYLAKQGHVVDYYFVANLLHDRRGTSGFEYPKAKRTLGNHQLSREEAPEIIDYMEGLPVRIFLSRIVHHDRYPWLNKMLMRLNMLQVKHRHYDAINIVGQISWIMEAHRVLKDENLIHTFHELGSHDGPLQPKPIVQAAISDGSKVILHSAATYQRFLTIPGADPAKTTMIPFGKFETLPLYVKHQEVALPFKDLSKPLLLFYGYILPYKGLDVLAEAMKQLQSDWDKFNLVIAGNGSDPTLPFFQSLPNAHVINRFLSNDEMMNLIRQSSIILLPYHTASQTGIIPTCTLYGKPFIATRVGAFPESLRDGYNGLLVDPNDPVAFAEAMHRVITDASLLATLSEGASQYGNGDAFDWEQIAEKTIKFFK